MSDDSSYALARPRTASLRRELRRAVHWLQLARFAVVGASGYAINLAVFAAAIAERVDYRLAATAAFGVALLNNFAWNRLWTFRDARGSTRAQAARFVVVSVAAFLLSLVVLDSLVRVGAPELPAQAAAVLTVTPVSFLANKLWSFRPQVP
jgi:dolichol-phosphate mannosyltransferase